MREKVENPEEEGGEELGDNLKFNCSFI